ncbi:MAG TPA: hypothetical protein VL728_07320 [Cyclobacteriaceae bacterium]|jgi:hypothetical protein|nr:hypothetical protein [Cyclobacteriaceae bacterium]
MRISTLGVGLAIVGLATFICSDIIFFTAKRAVDTTPVHIDKEQVHTAQWPRLTGVVLVIGGIAFTLKGRRRPI